MDKIILFLNNVAVYITLPLKYVLLFVIQFLRDTIKSWWLFTKKFYSSEVLKIELNSYGKVFKDLGTITSTQVANAVHAACGNCIVQFDDTKYTLYKEEDVRWFLSQDNVSTYKYLAEKFDCDDFAKILEGRLKEAFPGIPVSLDIVWIPKKNALHMVNGIILADEICFQHLYIEPQANMFVPQLIYSTWEHESSYF